jgi:hypothetical protein
MDVDLVVVVSGTGWMEVDVIVHFPSHWNSTGTTACRWNQPCRPSFSGSQQIACWLLPLVSSLLVAELQHTNNFSGIHSKRCCGEITFMAGGRHCGCMAGGSGLVVGKRGSIWCGGSEISQEHQGFYTRQRDYLEIRCS